MTEDPGVDPLTYLRRIVRRWKIVSGLTLLAAVVSGGLSVAAPTVYESSAIVAISDFGTPPVPSARAYLDLATGSTVILELTKNLVLKSGSQSGNLADLGIGLIAVPGSDPVLISLKATATDRKQAATVVNAWAEAFTQTASTTFNRAEDSSKSLQERLQLGRNELDHAEKELAGRWSQDDTDILQTQLNAQRNALTNLQATVFTLQTASEETTSLRTRLRRMDPAAQASANDDLAITLIQVKVLNATVQVQYAGSQGSSNRTVQTQLAAIDNLQAVISDRLQQMEKEITVTQAKILNLQGRFNAAESNRAVLLVRRDNARQLVRDLDLRASGARLDAASNASKPRVVEQASIAAVAAQPKRTTYNVLVAAVLALMVGALAAVGLDYVSTMRTQRASSQPGSLRTI